MFEIDCTGSPELSAAYHGTGAYLVAITKGGSPAIEQCLTPEDRQIWKSDERERAEVARQAHRDFDAQVAAFRAKHPTARVVIGFGFAAVISVPEDDGDIISWPPRVCDAYWRVGSN
jgi:hypothetical protein